MFLSDAFRSRVRYVTGRYIASESFVRPKGIFVRVIWVCGARIISNVRTSARFANDFNHFSGENGNYFQVLQRVHHVKFNVGFGTINSNFYHVFRRFKVDDCGGEDTSAYAIRLVRSFDRGFRVDFHIPAKIEDSL